MRIFKSGVVVGKTSVIVTAVMRATRMHAYRALPHNLNYTARVFGKDTRKGSDRAGTHGYKRLNHK